MLYQIHPVEGRPQQDEALGTKPKFWCMDDKGQQWLFKYARPNTGEDWTEKVAAEIAELLGIPHATVDLGEFDGHQGSLSLDLTEGGERGQLVLGNELLVDLDPEYPAGAGFFHQSEHTVQRVITALAVAGLPREFLQSANEAGLKAVCTATDLFIGYLMLDALIANQDRHHENWGIIIPGENIETLPELCPSFDHASSFAHNLSDDERNKRLKTRDRGYNMKTFAGKARSALFPAGIGRNRALSPIAAFSEAAKVSPRAAEFWLGQLGLMTDADVDDILDSVPSSRMSPVTKDFTRKLIATNKVNLLGLMEV